jgi:CheY-like chemotaxis protein
VTDPAKTKNTGTKPFITLLVDEDEMDRKVIKLAIERVHGEMETRDMEHGDEVIPYLEGKGRFENREEYPFPQLLVLNLKMPGMDGLGVMRWLNERPEHNALAVVMIPNSSLEQDILEAHRKGVKAYFAKPGDFNELEKLVTAITEFWKASLPDAP